MRCPFCGSDEAILEWNDKDGEEVCRFYCCFCDSAGEWCYDDYDAWRSFLAREGC